MKLDIDFVRSQFGQLADDSEFVFASNAGGSYVCNQVNEILEHYNRHTRVQPYSRYPSSAAAGEAMDRARHGWSAALNIDPGELTIGPSTSMNTYVMAQAMGDLWQPGDEIVVTNQDHEANIGAWRRLEADGMVLREWRVDPASGELDPADLDQLLGEKTRVVAFTHCSNIVGSVNPVRDLADRIHAAGALVFVDGVAFCPHGLPDFEQLGADLYTFSLYKVYGPHLGVMVMRRALNEALPNQGHFFNAGIPTARFTPAGPDHAQIAATNGVIDYFEAVDAHHGGDGGAGAARRVNDLFRVQEQSLLQPLLDFISEHSNTRLLGKAVSEARAPTVSFAVRGQTPAQLASRLGKENIGVGVGHCYAYRLIEALGIDPSEGVLRTSLVHYTRDSDVRRLIETLDTLL